MIGKGNAAPNGHIPFTPHAKQVLELSLREALQLGHSYIGTEHILLGLIREGEGVGTQVLIKMDVDLGELRSATIDMIHGNSGGANASGKGDLANAGGVPLIMSYWNLIYHDGVERFACDFENAGGAGLITPDLIPDEAGEWIEASDRHGLDRIFLVSPDSASERLELVARNARGFVYAASRMGVTGERDTISASPATLVGRARNAGARNVCVGIGVSTPEQGAKVGAYADGVIVGSALVHTLLDDDNVTAKAPKEGLRDLAAKVEALSEGIHNESR